ncbi:hypothetical protein EV1_026363 [Malus domestica]
MMAVSSKKVGATSNSDNIHQHAWWSSSSSIAALLFVVPLVVVFRLISLLDLDTTNWVFTSPFTSLPLNLTATSTSSGNSDSNDDVLGR